MNPRTFFLSAQPTIQMFDLQTFQPSVGLVFEQALNSSKPSTLSEDFHIQEIRISMYFLFSLLLLSSLTKFCQFTPAEWSTALANSLTHSQELWSCAAGWKTRQFRLQESGPNGAREPWECIKHTHIHTQRHTGK